MKKSKFVLLSMVLILLLCFSLFSVSVEVKAASDGELDIDIEEYWVQVNWPLSAMNYKDSDGKGITFYVEQVAELELEGTTIRIAQAYSAYDYEFYDGSISSNYENPILYQFCSDSLVSIFNYYRDTYGLLAQIPEFDKVLISWDVDQQRFVGPDYLFYLIETSFDEGYDEGHDEGFQEGKTENHDAAYYAGYDKGYGAGYEVGYDAARPEMDILLITLIMYILSIIIYFKFNLKWVLIGTTLLWFVPIFLVDNLFVKIFSVIMIIVTIVITFFSDREEEF